MEDRDLVLDRGTIRQNLIVCQQKGQATHCMSQIQGSRNENQRQRLEEFSVVWRVQTSRSGGDNPGDQIH
jgi:hypothetical protein